ncbi:hypothetical protein [Streptomyces sp. AK02-01A]|uniref:hypothetical protein n=1 Tax=Streptomyces sp. AK02-01A TaxID=3028648 RepID=UPI0029BA81A0|nr:hypothetical protein [Streptomyces sp. AK02-01A]MDX3850546.1 hypothetical protein [Streptomyces sp. AK02-01A]
MSVTTGVISERSSRFLEEGETVRRVYLAQGGINPWAQVGFFVAGLVLVRVVAMAAGADGNLGLFGGVLGGVLGAAVAAALTTRRVVAVTDRAVLLLSYGRFGAVKPNSVVARLPKGTRIGELSGTWAKTEIAGEKLWIHKKWHGDAAAFEPRIG